MGETQERKSERRIYVETMVEIAEDWSDGAFWGFMEEKGIDVQEVIDLRTEPEAEEEG